MFVYLKQEESRRGEGTAGTERLKVVSSEEGAKQGGIKVATNDDRDVREERMEVEEEKAVSESRQNHPCSFCIEKDLIIKQLSAQIAAGMITFFGQCIKYKYSYLINIIQCSS